MEIKIEELAEKINSFFPGKEIVIIGVLKGSLFFMSDLLKKIRLPFIYDFIQAKSYEGTETTGNVKIITVPQTDVKDKTVLIVEDIIDTGITLKRIVDFFTEKGAKEIYICSLLDKKGRRQNDLKADFAGFEIDNYFVVGYGLDLDERFRNLEEIFIYHPK
ncbi:MAG: hypoxanthine phosphoribosyltransferase [Proteobacteria bacterium]|nr:hypoxanthine phosphoribosyltransferase [Pseudomonadota bacterium]